MLTKENDAYALTLDSSVFLDKRSPAYFGGATEFLCSPMLMEGLRDLPVRYAEAELPCRAMVRLVQITPFG